jgi:hypothetical protein
LPSFAQASVGFGASLVDVDCDGRVDLYFVQNYFSPQIGIGRIDGGMSLLLRGDGRGGFSPVMPEESGLVVPGDGKSLGVTDLNGDGWPDFVVGLNNAPVAAFENQKPNRGQPFRVRLRGKNGNPAGIGARVRIRLDDDATQTAEVYAGDGYLSQSSAELVFGVANGQNVVSIDVRWPDGESSSTQPAGDQRLTIVEQPR